MSLRPRELVTLALIDGALLALFMMSVGVVVPLVDAPGSPIRELVPSDLARRALKGLAMGATAILLISSPWGARTGAHMNPGVTIAFLRLGKIPARTALAYIPAQILLGTLGVLAIGVIVGRPFTDDPIRYAPTVPERTGALGAMLAEFLISLVLMLAVLYSANTKRLARRTPAIVAALLALYITFESPLSGMSINPARTLASAIPGHTYTALWVYLMAPTGAMLLAAEIFLHVKRLPAIHCCKLNHSGRILCPFCGCDGPIDFDAHAPAPAPHPAVPPHATARDLARGTPNAHRA